jgi:hypothetical protein
MKFTLIAMALLVAGTSAAGGFSLGFKEVDVPTMVVDAGTAEMGSVGLLRLGSALSPEFRIEALLGYGKTSYDDDADNEYSTSTFAIGGSGFYVIASPSNTVFSIGGTLLYAKSSVDDGPETSDLSILPLMRIDFAFPQVSQVAFFSEFGLRYDKATTTVETSGDDFETTYSHFGTYNSPHILGGVYYSF